MKTILFIFILLLTMKSGLSLNENSIHVKGLKDEELKLPAISGAKWTESLSKFRTVLTG